MTSNKLQDFALESGQKLIKSDISRKKSKKISAFESKWKTFSKYIEIYFKNEPKLKRKERNQYTDLAKQLDELNESVFEMSLQEISNTVGYEERSIKVFFDIPVIKEYLADFDRTLIENNFRKIVLKVGKDKFTKDDLMAFKQLSQSIEKYADSIKPFEYIVTFAPAPEYKDKSKK